MSDQLEDFYNQCCAGTGDGSLARTNRFQDLYRYWYARNLVGPTSDSSIQAILTNKQHNRIAHEGDVHYQGLALIGHYAAEYILDVESAVSWDPDLLVDPLAAPFTPSAL